MITIEHYNPAQARKALLEKGREILVKDNMIDEEKARAEAAAHETASETVTRLEAELEAVVAAMGDMMAKYRGLQVTHCHYCRESVHSAIEKCVSVCTSQQQACDWSSC